jgi:hypothetical protein
LLVAKGTRMTQEFALLKKLIDNTAVNCHTIGSFFGVNGKNLQRQYKDTSVHLVLGA